MKQVKDHYFQRAKAEGYAARSVYKLEQIDRKQRLLRAGGRVLDLGAAPGSWSQYAAERVGSGGRVVAVDVQPVAATLPAWVESVVADATEVEPETLRAWAHAGQGGAFDLVLSDMAPRTTGIPSADAARSAALVRAALELAAMTLRPGGALLAKVFQGAELPALRSEFRGRFAKVTVEKPKASRSESVEVYLLGRDFQQDAS